jgi:hypothetical protein
LHQAGGFQRGQPAFAASRKRRGDPVIHFIVHDEGDSVGVIVVEGVKASQDLTGWIMDQDREIQVARRAISP